MEMARRLYRRGAWFDGTARDCPPHMRKSKELSPASICVVAELSDSTAIHDDVRRDSSYVGRLDALVNNAATQNPSPLHGIEGRRIGIWILR